MAEPARRGEAGGPADTAFKTCQKQGIEGIDAAIEARVPFAWLTADEEFGQNPALREHLEKAGISYVMAVPKNTVHTDPAGQVIHLNDLAAQLNHTAWQRRACGIGTKGFRVYDWALIDTGHADHHYMIRKSIDDGELPFYRCHNPEHAGFGDLVTVAGARRPIQECFGSGKNEVGLDGDPVRKYSA